MPLQKEHTHVIKKTNIFECNYTKEYESMLRVFEFMKVMLANFILAYDGFSNYNIDFINLVSCGKTINKIMMSAYTMRGNFKWHGIENFDYERKKFVHCVMFVENISLNKDMFF
jgi:hypothetical protein